MEGDRMASPATSTYLPTLEVPHEREGVGHELQATLHELIDLSLIGKQLHWAVVGPLFRPLHLQLDELVVSWHELSDTVSERSVAEVSDRVRNRMNRLGDADLASQDVLIEVVRELEKQQWMLRAQLGEHA